MKVYTDQCPLCLQPVQEVEPVKEYPCVAVCGRCGGMSIGLSATTARAPRFGEVRNMIADEEIPADIIELHDRAVADKWG